MAAGADSIDDLDVIRAGGMARLFAGVYARTDASTRAARTDASTRAALAPFNSPTVGLRRSA
jgi:hypothetical protein